MRWTRAGIALAVAGAVMVPVAAGAQEMDGQDPEIREWTVPYPESRPRDPYVGPDGRVWFVGQAAHYAAYLEPETGEFTRYDMDDGTGPHTLIVSDEGTVYYAGNRARHIGIIHPESGDIEKVMMPDERARDPHTMAWNSNGDIWFTVQGGNLIGFLDTETRETRFVEAPEVQGGRGSSSRPYGLKVDSRDRPWIALLGTNLIGMVDPASFELLTYELPEGARPRRLAIDAEDRIWYVDFARGKLGLVVDGDGFQREWELPGGEGSRPYGMAIDSDDRVWLVETGVDPNRFVGFDTDAEEFISRVEIPSGAGAVRHMYYDEDTNSVWFGTDVNTIGQAALPPAGTGN